MYRLIILLIVLFSFGCSNKTAEKVPLNVIEINSNKKVIYLKQDYAVKRSEFQVADILLQGKYTGDFQSKEGIFYFHESGCFKISGYNELIEGGFFIPFDSNQEVLVFQRRKSMKYSPIPVGGEIGDYLSSKKDKEFQKEHRFYKKYAFTLTTNLTVKQFLEKLTNQ